MSTNFFRPRKLDVFCLPGGGAQDHDLRVSSSGHLGLPRTPHPETPKCPQAFGTEKKAVCCGQDGNQWVTGSRLSAPRRRGAHGATGAVSAHPGPSGQAGLAPLPRTAGPATETPRTPPLRPVPRSGRAAHHPGAPLAPGVGHGPPLPAHPGGASSWFHLRPSYPHLPGRPRPASAPRRQGPLPPHDRLPHTSLSLSDLPSAVATLAAATSETLPDRYWPGAGPPPSLLPAPAAGLCPPSAEAGEGGVPALGSRPWQVKRFRGGVTAASSGEARGPRKEGGGQRSRRAAPGQLPPAQERPRPARAQTPVPAPRKPQTRCESGRPAARGEAPLSSAAVTPHTRRQHAPGAGAQRPAPTH